MSDLQERVVWGKLIGDIEKAITGVNGRVSKRSSKSIEFEIGKSKMLIELRKKQES